MKFLPALGFALVRALILALAIAAAGCAKKPAGLLVLTADTPFAGSQLFYPGDGRPHPGVLVLHGSEGGSQVHWKLEAQFLAMHGFTALAYCYFDCKRSFNDHQQTLAGVEVMDAYRALDWLRKSPQAAGRKTAVYGLSRGGELALLLASLIAGEPGLIEPDAIAAHSPADRVAPAWNWDWSDVRCSLCKKGGVSCKGSFKPEDYIWNPMCGQDPVKMTTEQKQAWKWKGQGIRSGSRIEIEKSPGPLLITVGKKDRMWSPEQSKRLTTSLEKANIPHDTYFFEGEDHVFANEAEQKRKLLVVEFLRKNLGD